jgi:alanine racemase
MVKTVPAGTPVSYGGTFVTDKETVIATIPVGYGDGYPRSLSGKGYVLIDGKRAPILGRVCMDQFMVDVTDIADVKEGDEVVLMGQDKKSGEIISAELLGELSGRFNYELTCDISKRVPRQFVGK